VLLQKPVLGLFFLKTGPKQVCLVLSLSKRKLSLFLQQEDLSSNTVTFSFCHPESTLCPSWKAEE
jgi:hypothetical protein